MSRLIPSNLSNPRWKPHKRHKLFSSGYSASYRKREGKPADTTEGEVQTQTGDNLNGTAKGEKRRPVPVVMVDQDPLQEMEPDEYGAELGKEARVWKVYVKETDQWDAELVDGWNRSLDVILVFAALFSAVSTAFLIESSKKLEEDPSEVSAAALRAISQFLLSGANSSSMDLPPSDPNVTSGFTPTRHAVIVNTLWYLSLSLSIATSLLAMLAKDWCHSFSANRTGHPWDQALRRQRKWEMIERWKMQELITVLPSLIHLSLLLFATGLCIYVWDTNVTAAIPIICVSGAAFAFYMWSSIMASIMKLFPYTTIISRTLQSEFMQRQYVAIRKHWKWCIVQVLMGMRVILSSMLKWTRYGLAMIIFASAAVICLPLLLLDILPCICPRIFPPDSLILDVYHSPRTFWLTLPMLSVALYAEMIEVFDITDGIDTVSTRAIQYIESASLPASSDKDKITSLALKWLIQNCETPSSVTIALQAIAGASSRIPSDPLKECQATLEILRRLVSIGPANSEESETDSYIRALTFLGLHADAPLKDEGTEAIEKSQGVRMRESPGDLEVAIWDLRSEYERQVVDLINSTRFRPTKENITALTLGNSATSLSLRLRKGERRAASEAFGSITDLLLDHARSGNQKLHPVALHSLGHAAVMLHSCTDISFLSHDLTNSWMERCVSLLSEGASSRRDPPQSQLVNTSLKPETAVVMCLLLHGYSPAQTNPAFTPPQASVNARVKRAIHLLTDKCLANPSSQMAFFRVGLLEILFKAEQYRVEWHKVHQHRKDISENLVKSNLLLSGLAREGLKYPWLTYTDNAGVLDFLVALDQLYELLIALYTNNSAARRMNAPTYCTLICVASRAQSEAQLTLCQHLLSSCAFPKLDDCLVLALGSALDDLWSQEFREWNQQDPVTVTVSPRFPILAQRQKPEASVESRLRHCAAIQTWLLLCLVGDASTTQQNDLKDMVRKYMYRNQEGLPVHQAKQVLEDEIIRSYSQRHHLGVYSARVIECILEARGTPPNDELALRIQRDLEYVPACIRGLSSFLDSTEVCRLKSQLTTNEPGAIPAPNIPQTMPTESDPDGRSASKSGHPPPGTDRRPPSISSLVQAVNTPLPPSTAPSLFSLHLEYLESTHGNRNVSHVSIPISPSLSPIRDA